MHDLVFKGGTLYDGSGLPPFTADVAVKDGIIREIGRVKAPARRTIDIDGLAIAPGFIDLHTHMDAQFFWDPLGSSLNEHGVTSVVIGNCGLTLAPCRPSDHDALLGTFARVEGMPRSVLDSAIRWEWESHGEYMQALARRPLGLNIATFVGHNAVRQYVMGEASVEREATVNEVLAMQGLVREGIAAGAYGFSTDLNNRHFREDGRPIPSRAASRSEIDLLCGVVGEANRGVIQFSHGGPESARHIEWYNAVASANHRPVIWQSILQTWSQPDLWRTQLKGAAASFRRGAPAYPLTNARSFSNRWTLKNTQTFDELPTWKTLAFVPIETRKQAFCDPQTRAKLAWEAVDDTRVVLFSRRWDVIMIHRTARPENRQWEGRSVADLAAATGKSVMDAFLDLALEEDLETVFENSDINGDHAAVAEILRSPYTLVGQSDAGAHLAFDAGFGYATTLLGYWVRERRAMSLEEAVRKLTFMVASVFGMRDRGLLRPGMAGDAVVFDPATVGAEDRELVHDLPEGEARYVQHARGIHYTAVNGQLLMEHGSHTGAFPGGVLRDGGI